MADKRPPAKNMAPPKRKNKFTGTKVSLEERVNRLLRKQDKISLVAFNRAFNRMVGTNGRNANVF